MMFNTTLDTATAHIGSSEIGVEIVEIGVVTVEIGVVEIGVVTEFPRFRATQELPKAPLPILKERVATVRTYRL